MVTSYPSRQVCFQGIGLFFEEDFTTRQTTISSAYSTYIAGGKTYEMSSHHGNLLIVGTDYVNVDTILHFDMANSNKRDDK